jgi:hypothetical protein
MCDLSTNNHDLDRCFLWRDVVWRYYGRRHRLGGSAIARKLSNDQDRLNTVIKSRSGILQLRLGWVEVRSTL